MKSERLSSPIKVWYKALPQFSKVLWPTVDIQISHKDIVLPQLFFALVDSGASMSILHKEIAEVLGFNLKDLGSAKIGGLSVSGEYKSWILPKPITIKVYGYSFQFRFQVIDNPNLIWPCILGEDSIFDVARLDFQKFKAYFELRFRHDIH